MKMIIIQKILRIFYMDKLNIKKYQQKRLQALWKFKIKVNKVWDKFKIE